ncbi:MAG: type I 3-dehydroquinate dehydratase [Pyrinomonadaceae bacterium]|nr:type I 3-dehydroquinate dehydratase [Pyrinomonadaceae bacterium]
MNQGKICISICARTSAELFEKLGRAERLADVVEIRFDCLEDDSAVSVIERLKSARPPVELLATSRPKTEQQSAEFNERLTFWRHVFESGVFDYVDLEEDLVFALTYNDDLKPADFGKTKIVGSYHDFYETPPDMTPVLEVFKPGDDSDFRCDIVKIATTANTITDTIEQWYLLDWAKHFGVGAVPITMGEPGKWTRILGLAHGAVMTYAALDAGGETAPGQITAADLLDVYRVKELGNGTEVYGVIAGDTSYSMSPHIQNAAFKAAKMDRVFVPLQVGDIGDFIRRMVRKDTREIELNFRGFAVTNRTSRRSWNTSTKRTRPQRRSVL